MSESQQPWFDRPLAATIVGGVVSAALIGLATLATAEMSKAAIPLWMSFLIGGAVLLAGSFLVPPWRRLIWVNVVKCVKWFLTIEHIPAKRLDDMLTDAEMRGAALVQEKQLKEAHRLGKEVFRLTAERDGALADLSSATETLKREGQNVAAPTVPLIPLPAPRWSIRMAKDDFDQFFLVNSVPRSVAKEVRIESDWKCTITNAGHWPDLSDAAQGHFTAELSGAGRQQGVVFQVAWFDENAVKRTAPVALSNSTIAASAPF